MKVRFAAAFDTAKGILQVDMFSIDTSGNVTPADSVAGFLPPDVDGISGTAGLSYYLYARNLNTLDTFSNKANVYFDNNAPVVTNTWINTVDTAGPKTKLAAALYINDSTSKLVIQQSDIGSGNQYNTLFGKQSGDSVYRKLGIAYGDTIIFKADRGSTYRLYVKGTDNVNNKEAKDSAAEVIYSFTNGSLPLLVTKFMGQYLNGVDHLTTTVANEINVNTIQLQKSLDGNHFVFQGNMAVAPVNSGTYNYNDPNPAPGNNYYRLRIIDIDGNSTFSNIVVLHNRDRGAITIFPNPAATALNVRFTNAAPGKYLFTLTDIAGRTLQRSETTLIGGSETVVLSVAGYAPGSYVLSITDPNGNKVINRNVLKE